MYCNLPVCSLLYIPYKRTYIEFDIELYRTCFVTSILIGRLDKTIKERSYRRKFKLLYAVYKQILTQDS